MQLADPDSRDEERSILRCLVERVDMDPLKTDIETTLTCEIAKLIVLLVGAEISLFGGY